MLNGNQLERYGAMSKSLGLMSPNGKVFFVGKTTLASYQDFVDDFPIDKQGGNRIFPTITAALADSNVVASRGDVILVMPGHTEAVTSTSITVSKAGLNFIGLGEGALKPTLTFGATSSTINMNAANCKWQNFRWQAGVGDVVTAVLHATHAENTQYIDIEFYATSTFNFINGFTLGAANISDGCKWERVYLRTADAGQLALCITAAAQNDLKFYDNYVVHAAAAAGLLTAGAADLLGLDIKRNFVQTGQSDGSVGVLVITTSTASSGRITDNDMKTADAAANVAIPIASKVYAARNYIAGADEVGTVVAVGTLFDNT